ncbi:preprotein translocase subunit SecE [Crassaminicella thermophila]|uniref:Protein translocase subunit SecE n=1 Tax=Crassaminicella thermophila TaxID=2599308 RepID=A0A5C0S9D0_CRATE|nr:preprotein translocase subunit SecE [Crassaminicella thermophila]QEK11153.1 preprotein translocase subunit SecE [Crassaminicella thermophila]
MAVQTNTNKAAKSRDVGKFFRHVKAELKKVIWPSKKELTSYTTVVLTTCAVVAIGIWLVDTIFGKALQLIIK